VATARTWSAPCNCTARKKRLSALSVAAIDSGETRPDSNTLAPSRVTSRSSWTTRRLCCTTRAIFSLHEFEPISTAAKVCIDSGVPWGKILWAVECTIHESDCWKYTGKMQFRKRWSAQKDEAWWCAHADECPAPATRP